MTKEELEKAADEYEKANYEEVQYGESYFQKPCVSIAQAFIDGAEFAYQWHDLRKDPNDLPKESGEYWCKLKEKRRYTFEVYYTDSLFYKSRWEELDIIAWCELPMFEE